MQILTDNEKILFKRTLTYFNPFKFHIIGLYFITIVTTILELLPTYYIGKIIDYIVSRSYQGVIDTLLILLIIFLVNSALSFAETYLNNLLKNRIALIIKNDFFAKIVKLPTNIFDEIRVGEFISRIEEDTAIIARFYIEDILNILLSLVTVIVTGYFIFKLSTSLSLIAMATFPFTFLIYYLFGRKIKKYNWEGRKIKDNYFSFIQETLSSIREVKCLTIEANVSNRFVQYSKQFFANSMNVSIASTFSGLFNLTISTVSDWIIIAYGAWLIIGDKLSIGSFVAFNGYISKFLNGIQKIISTNLTIQATSVSLERIYYLLDTEGENDTAGLDIPIINGDITIKGLKFNYQNSVEEPIQNLSLKIEPNTLDAIVGLNGCGKSTLLNLLVRLYEKKDGEIYIDGIPIENFNLKTLRQNVAYIRQEPYLFNASIYENLLLANPLAAFNEIQDACKKAYIHDYILNLPEKYQTILGEGGAILSGGQKQRLSLARAILKKSKILLLDEVTSDLDGESEFYIMKSIHELSKDHTVLMVTHRLSSLVDSSKILVMNGGVIEDNGTHEELADRSDIYRRLFRERMEKKHAQ